MSAQEGRAKATKKAEKVVAAKLAAGPVTDAYDTERPDGVAEEAWKLAVAIRHLRDAGESWWRVGYLLGFEGANGDTLAESRKAAPRVRAAYDAVFGDHPKAVRQKPVKAPPEKDPVVAGMKRQKVGDRRAAARTGHAHIPIDMPDDEVAAMLVGRKISWVTNMNDLDHKGDRFIENTAHVHPTADIRVEMIGSHRCVHFVEVEEGATGKHRNIGTGLRTVRVDRIHTIK